MATKTLGTLATSTLTAVQWTPAISDADVASIQALIYDPAVLQISGVKRVISAFVKAGIVYVPGRGVLQLQPNDWVAVDPATGIVIVIPANALAATLTVTGTTTSTSTTLSALSANVLAQGWLPGMPITGTNIPANTYIVSIAANGLSLVLSAAATGSAANTMTVCNFTHS